jgi:V8-like Glu-specific endopeptidase
MADESSTPTDVATDPHAPVSSEVESGTHQLEKDVLSDGPSTGEGGTVIEPSDGLEAVAAVAAEALALQEVVPDLTGLRPIGEASYGGGGAEAVIGVDNRIQITNTQDYPWRVHASLLVTARDGSRWIGTGWFIGPHTLVTAGHVVYVKNSGVPGRDGWAQSVQVMPGRNGSTLPYGSVTTSNLRTVNGWVSNGDPEYDYGAIILPTDLGARTGWFGFGAYTDATLVGSSVNISGYPGDKPSGTQWYHWNTVTSVGPRKVFYQVDTFGGQSGSAVYRIDNGGRYGVAVHAYGGSASNSGTRITQQVFDNFVAWKA